MSEDSITSTTRIYAPDGIAGTARRALAASPSTLAGKRIGALDNGKPGAAFLLETLGRGLAQRTQAQFVGVFAKGSAATPCEEGVFAELAGAADLILTGTAD
ncbi:MAG: hypothetical protein AB8G23_21665 [Myxococcota bacterium]